MVRAAVSGPVAKEVPTGMDLGRVSAGGRHPTRVATKSFFSCMAARIFKMESCFASILLRRLSKPGVEQSANRKADANRANKVDTGFMEGLLGNGVESGKVKTF